MVLMTEPVTTSRRKASACGPQLPGTPTGRYRLTATWNMAAGTRDPWLLHVENLAAQAGFRSIGWQAVPRIEDPIERVRALVGSTVDTDTIEVRVIVPPEHTGKLDKLAALLASGGSDVAVDRERAEVLDLLARLGLSSDEAALAVSSATPCDRSDADG